MIGPELEPASQWPTHPNLSMAWTTYLLSNKPPLPTRGTEVLPPDISHSVPARIAEFLAGRHCAKRALETLGSADSSVGRNTDCSPKWPRGFTGSIAHSGGYAGAVVGSTHRYRGIGFDIEKIFAMDFSKFGESFLTDSEVAYLETLSPTCRVRHATVIFSTKESVFKCIYTQCRIYFDFLDVQVAHFGPDRVSVLFRSDLGLGFREGTSIQGEYRVWNGFVWTGVFLEA